MAIALINADRALSIFLTQAWFPTVGKEGVLYFAQDTEITYRWDVNSGTYVQFASAIAGVTDHGLLTGLADDDHPQYALDTDLSAHVAAADPHPQYALDTDLATINKDYISGLVPTWVSATAINITPGNAYIESLGRIYVSSATISLTGLTTTATTWYYLYLYDNAGTPAVEISITAPAAPYMGTARSKSADTSRRFLGAIKTAAANTIIRFQQVKNRWFWRTGSGIDFRVLSAGAATVATVVSLSSGMPVTSTVALLRIFNLAGAGTTMYSSHGDDAVDTSAIYYLAVDSQQQAYVDYPTNSSQQIKYINSAAGGSSYVDMLGFIVER